MIRAPYIARRFVSSLLVLSLVSTSGCAGWRTVSREELAREVRGHRPTNVRVLFPDSTVEIGDPAVRTDSLVGTARRWGAMAPVSVALAEVDSAAVPRRARMPALLIAVPMAALMIAIAIAIATDEGGVETNP